jgi:hypothetical protein
MILYRKDFPLGEGVSFAQYIKALEEETIPGFAFIFEKTSSPDRYRAKLSYIWSLGQPRWRKFAFGGVLLSECEILHSEWERSFTLQASPMGINLFLFFMNLIIASLLFIFGLITFISYNTVTFQNIAILLLATFVLSAPSIDLYRHDKKLLNKIGSIGMEIGKK